MLAVVFILIFFSLPAFSADERLPLDEIKRRLQEDPENKEALSQLGLFYTVEKQYDKAVETYFEIIRIDPKNFHAYNNLGILYKKVGQFKDSLFCYQKALAINPDSYLAHYNIGLAYESMGRMQEAREAYGRSLSLNPEFAQALQRLKELSDDPASAQRLPAPEPRSEGKILVVDSTTGQPKILGATTPPPEEKKPPKPADDKGSEADKKPDDKATPEPAAKTEEKEPKKKGAGEGKKSEMVRTLRTGPGVTFYNRAMDALEKDDMKTAVEQYVTCIMQDREFLSEPDNGLIQKGLQLLQDRPNSMSEGLFYRGYLQHISGKQDAALPDFKAYVAENKKGPYKNQAQTFIDTLEAKLQAARAAEIASQTASRMASTPAIVANATFTPRIDDTEIKKMNPDEIIEESKRLSREGRLRDALAVIQTALEKERENLSLLVAQANLYTDMMLLQGDNEAGKMARNIFEKILSLAQPSSREAEVAKSMIKELSTRLK